MDERLDRKDKRWLIIVIVAIVAMAAVSFLLRTKEEENKDYTATPTPSETKKPLIDPSVYDTNCPKC